MEQHCIILARMQHAIEQGVDVLWENISDMRRWRLKALQLRKDSKHLQKAL
jgi:hypothetical protein